MSEYRPVRTLEELDALDTAECVEGYWAARDGWPEPGNNHTRSYWHGWRCGAMDKGVIPIDAEHRELTHLFAERERARNCSPTPSQTERSVA